MRDIIIMLAILALFPLLCDAKARSYDPFSLGKSYYSAGKMEAALDCLQKAATAKPNDAIIHYYLAITLLRLNSMEKAKIEFERAISLQPDGQAAEFSQTALTLLNSKIKQEAEIVNQSDSKTSSLKAAFQQIHNQAEDHLQMYNQAQKKIDEAIKQAEAILEEGRQHVSWMREQYFLSRGKCGAQKYPLYSEEEIEAFRMESEKKAKGMRDNAIQQAAVLKEMSAENEGTALNLETQLMDNKPKKIKLVPQGTSLYVRNYQTASEEEGLPIPLIAEPKKLQVKKAPNSAEENNLSLYAGYSESALN